MSVLEEELLDGIVRAWVLQCLHILISKPKATDFHLCETESTYVVLRISLGVRWSFIGSLYTRLGSSLSTGLIHVQLSLQLGPTLLVFCKLNIINFLRAQPCHM